MISTQSHEDKDPAEPRVSNCRAQSADQRAIGATAESVVGTEKQALQPLSVSWFPAGTTAEVSTMSITVLSGARGRSRMPRVMVTP